MNARPLKPSTRWKFLEEAGRLSENGKFHEAAMIVSSEAERAEDEYQVGHLLAWEVGWLWDNASKLFTLAGEAWQSRATDASDRASAWRRKARAERPNKLSSSLIHAFGVAIGLSRYVRLGMPVELKTQWLMPGRRALARLRDMLIKLPFGSTSRKGKK